MVAPNSRHAGRALSVFRRGGARGLGRDGDDARRADGALCRRIWSWLAAGRVKSTASARSAPTDPLMARSCNFDFSVVKPAQNDAMPKRFSTVLLVVVS